MIIGTPLIDIPYLPSRAVGLPIARKRVQTKGFPPRKFLSSFSPLVGRNELYA
jgi:hypothetical protein